MEIVFHYNSRKTSPKTTKNVKKVEKNFFACLFYKYIVLLRKIGKCFSDGSLGSIFGGYAIKWQSDALSLQKQSIINKMCV